MGELLLITDDPNRGARLARGLEKYRSCRILDLYEESAPDASPAVIIADVAALSSDAVKRLRRVLRTLRHETTPLLFLLHGDGARSRMQAVALEATSTVSATAATQVLLEALQGLSPSETHPDDRAERHADAARQFLREMFVADRPITPASIDTGSQLISQALLETGVRDWVREVRRFDDATHQHCLLVAGLAASFAQTLGFSPADCHHLTRAALLHDVGKIHVPKEILNKPDRLTPPERAIMETHPARGHAMLEQLGFATDLLAVVRSHHEMLDGSGYPDRLQGTEIPDLVRLVTVCDIYGALIERRPYKAAMSGAAAYAILEGMSGRLDGALVRAFGQVATAFDPSATAIAGVATTDRRQVEPVRASGAPRKSAA